MTAPLTLWRYIGRSVLSYVALGFAISLLVVLVHCAMRAIDEVLAAGVGPVGLVKLLSIMIPTYLSYALPTALLMGILLAFGRLSADGEVLALRAAGVGVAPLLAPVIVFGVAVSVLMGYLIFEVEPRTYLEMRQLVREMASSSRMLEPGRFLALGSYTLYVHDQGDASCPLRGVLITDKSDARRTTYIAASCGSPLVSEHDTLVLELRDGSIHFQEASDRYQLIRFVSMRSAIDLDAYLRRPPRAKELTFGELLEIESRLARGEQPELRGRWAPRAVEVELHRRVAISTGALLLAVLAVPLGVRPLRTGRSAGVLTAVGLLTVYWVALTAGQNSAMRGWVPAWLGLWAANGLTLLLALILLRTLRRREC